MYPEHASSAGRSPHAPPPDYHKFPHFTDPSATVPGNCSRRPQPLFNAGATVYPPNATQKPRVAQSSPSIAHPRPRQPAERVTNTANGERRTHRPAHAHQSGLRHPDSQAHAQQSRPRHQEETLAQLQMHRQPRQERPVSPDFSINQAYVRRQEYSPVSPAHVPPGYSDAHQQRRVTFEHLDTQAADSGAREMMVRNVHALFCRHRVDDCHACVCVR